MKKIKKKKVKKKYERQKRKREKKWTKKNPLNNRSRWCTAPTTIKQLLAKDGLLHRSSLPKHFDWTPHRYVGDPQKKKLYYSYLEWKPVWIYYLLRIYSVLLFKTLHCCWYMVPILFFTVSSLLIVERTRTLL